MGNVDNSGLKVNLFETPLEVQYVRLVPMIDLNFTLVAE